jgi:hypothetical protein
LTSFGTYHAAPGTDSYERLQLLAHLTTTAERNPAGSPAATDARVAPTRAPNSARARE